MLKSKLILAVLAASGLMLSAGASAQVYIGGTAGQAKWSDDCKLTTKCDTSSTAFKVLSGYNIDKHFAVEASYFTLGKMTANANVSGINANLSVKGTGVEIAGIVKMDFDEKFGGFAKVGVARIKADAHSSVAGYGKYSQDTSSTKPVLGLGLTYKINDEFALRGEVESRRISLGQDRNTVRNVSVGMQYSF